MRVLYFHQYFCTPQGSGGTRSYAFARTLIEQGHEVTMVCGTHAYEALRLPVDEGRGWLRGVIDGIDVIALPLGYANEDGMARRCLTFMRYAFRSVRLALSESYDLIFATSTPLTAAVPGIFARWGRRKPFVFEVRDLWPELPRALGMRNPLLLGGMALLERSAYRSCHMAIGLAPGIVEGIQRRSRAQAPVRLIPNGCDLEVFHPDLRVPLPSLLSGVKDAQFVAGFAGAHGAANGLDAVLDAAAALKKRGDSRIRLVLIGEGKAKASLMERARRDGLDNCLFFPPRPKWQLAEVMASLDAGLMVLRDVPAFYEGTSPNKFFDYLASGIPIVTNYPGWLARMVEDENCGVAVEPGDASALADVLQELAAEPERCLQMGRVSRAMAERRFSRAKLAIDFCECLENVAGWRPSKLNRRTP